MISRDVTDLYREYGSDRVPPGQRTTPKFPIFSKDDTPSWNPDEWTFTISGAVEQELTFGWNEFRSLPAETQLQDFHCVTGWSKLDCRFTGIPFIELADRAGLRENATHVMFSALDGYTTDLPLETCLRPEVLFAYEYDGEPLPPDHGGPLRVVTPHRYAYKGAKWVTDVEILTEPERGYWERRGYSGTADPWAEERYR